MGILSAFPSVLFNTVAVRHRQLPQATLPELRSYLWVGATLLNSAERVYFETGAKFYQTACCTSKTELREKWVLVGGCSVHCAELNGICPILAKGKICKGGKRKPVENGCGTTPKNDLL